VRNGTGKRVQARVVLKKELGCVGGRRGRGSGRACVSACVLVHGGRGEGGADRAVPRHSERERESRRVGVTVRRSDEVGPRGRGGEGRAGEGNWHRQSGPTGQREGERARGEGNRR
jgi:hypothetical protein